LNGNRFRANIVLFFGVKIPKSFIISGLKEWYNASEINQKKVY